MHALVIEGALIMRDETPAAHVSKLALCTPIQPPVSWSRQDSGQVMGAEFEESSPDVEAAPVLATSFGPHVSVLSVARPAAKTQIENSPSVTDINNASTGGDSQRLSEQARWARKQFLKSPSTTSIASTTTGGESSSLAEQSKLARKRFLKSDSTTSISTTTTETESPRFSEQSRLARHAFVKSASTTSISSRTTGESWSARPIIHVQSSVNQHSLASADDSTAEKSPKDNHASPCDVIPTGTTHGSAGIEIGGTAQTQRSQAPQARPDGFFSGMMRRLGGAPVTSSREESLIIWDWDDTLIPSSWLQKVMVPEGEQTRVRYTEALVAHTRVLREALQASHAVARVAIVTLASDRWMRYSLDNYFVGIQEVLNRLGIPVLCASQNMCTPAQAKRTEMRECLRKFYPDASVRKNVLSIGDMAHEREALQGLASPSSLSFCKTIKLREAPTLTEVQTQLKLITPMLPGLVGDQSSFDKTTEGMMFKAVPQLRKG